MATDNRRRGALTDPSETRWIVDDEAVAWREVGDEIVVLQMATASYLSINGTGRHLWLRLAGGATEAELAAALIESFEVSRDVAVQDVVTFVSELQVAGLIRPST